MKKFAFISLAVFAGLLVLLFGAFLFSPWSYNRSAERWELAHEVTVKASPGDVYRYLGNSNNAAKWSVFVNHIRPLNAELVPDGDKGSFRRCFHDSDEQGMQWDEEIIRADSASIRTLSIFNIQRATLQTEGLRTNQVYTPEGSNTRLRFELYYEGSFFQPNRFWKSVIGGYVILPIFKNNMANIARLVEAEQAEKAYSAPGYAAPVTLHIAD
ncbi:MAG: SRPBCC family protein [Bacteroidota bacterium]